MVMDSVRELKEAFSVASGDPELVRSQLQAFGRQIPLLYFILMVNTIAVAVTHYRFAPKWVVVYTPAFLCLICTIRCVNWWKARHRVLTHEHAVSELRKTTRLASILGAGFSIWSFTLFPYGGPYEQAQVAFYMATTLVGCVFCLMHVRAAALSLLLIVVIPFTVFFVSTRQPVFVAMAVDMMLVGTALCFIIHIYYLNFSQLVQSQRDLLATQIRTQTLSDENFRLASIDSLTSLPNRRSFFSSLAELAQQQLAPMHRFDVGLIDLDGFKQVNDVYGHATGDQVLSEVGRRLLTFATPDVLLSRLGGDEFGIIVKMSRSNDALVALAEKICEQLSRPYWVSGNVAELSGTIGWATFPQTATTVEQLFERADYALYFGKESQRGRPVIYSAEHETRIRRASLIAQELRRADLEAELYLVFQPIYDVMQQKPVGFEALARWQNLPLGQVQPDEFIRVAERTDLILHVTEVLLRKALAEVHHWPASFCLSFNLSVIDISSLPRSQRLLDIVSLSRVPPSRVNFEITETALTRDFEQARGSLALIKEAGCSVSLDDFGTGYSSLTYIHRLPFDQIKIDRSFVAKVDADAASRNIVKSVMDLCNNLELRCVVEGVETQSQLDILRDIGGVIMQGYFFGRPMRAEAIGTYLAEAAAHLGHPLNPAGVPQPAGTAGSAGTLAPIGLT
jgi:diguanylate cyclase (GGDEF)-like protein